MTSSALVQCWRAREMDRSIRGEQRPSSQQLEFPVPRRADDLCGTVGVGELADLGRGDCAGGDEVGEVADEGLVVARAVKAQQDLAGEHSLQTYQAAEQV